MFSGPPGLGKTTLAQIVARELGVNFRSTSGPVLAQAGDLAAILTNLEPRDVLFIDEIHRLNPAVEEILYPAMEDYELDLVIGEGPSARSVKITLAPFTLVGATTRSGLITTPLRDRFGIPVRLNFYSAEELVSIVERGARVLGFDLTSDGAREIAGRARGTPRIAGRLLKRVRDFAAVGGKAIVDAKIADAALTRLEVDKRGPRCFRPSLSEADRGILCRRPGRRRNHCGSARRSARCYRGSGRTLPDAAGLRAAHAAWPRVDGRGLCPSGPAATAARSHPDRPVRERCR